MSLQTAYRADRMGEADFTCQAGANELKARIEAYWRARGHEVQVMLIEAPFTQAIRSARYDVRSELVNGLPRARNDA
jgi:hypothetical protein